MRKKRIKMQMQEVYVHCSLGDVWGGKESCGARIFIFDPFLPSNNRPEQPTMKLSFKRGLLCGSDSREKCSQ